MENVPVTAPNTQPAARIPQVQLPLPVEKHAAPAPPVHERKPPPNTLFGEKLQAVLRK
jgi:hypothetical protein